MNIGTAAIRRAAIAFVLAMVASGVHAQTAGDKLGRELIADSHFQRGFILWNPKPGAHVRNGVAAAFEKTSAPVWGLCQWSSRFPLAEKGFASSDALVFSNAAKSVTVGEHGTPAADLTLAANAGVEYLHTRTSTAEPWVHLLVEQEFDPPERLQNLSAARLHIEARLLKSVLVNSNGYSPDLHAAQFQIFFTVQNRNHESPGFGDLLWFGVPLYDNRARFPAAFKAQDFGGTAKFIFTLDGHEFSGKSLHDGEWVTVDKDLLPLMREALETAWKHGFLKDSHDIADYTIGGMNMGWELPGTFDVAMQVRNLSLLGIRKPSVK